MCNQNKCTSRHFAAMHSSRSFILCGTQTSTCTISLPAHSLHLKHTSRNRLSWDWRIILPEFLIIERDSLAYARTVPYINWTTVPFRPSVQSHIMAEKFDCFKIRLNSKENLSAFSETKNSKIVNTWSKWYSTY